MKKYKKRNLGGVLFLSIFAVMALLVTGILLAIINFWHVAKENDGFAIFVAVMVAIIGSICIWLKTETIFIDSISEGYVIIENNTIVARFVGTWEFWRWQKENERLARGGTLEWAPPFPFIVTMETRPITENPKVRNLRYMISVVHNETVRHVRDLPKFLESYSMKGWGSAEKVVQYLCFEFNEQQSKEAAKFYNPLDENQQKGFEKLLRAFFVERFKGLEPFRIISVRFSL